MATSKIEWTEQTWNPTTGCVKVSAGCKHCYAETMARRLQAMGAPSYKKGFKLSIHPDRLGHPLRRIRPTTFFVNSMSDLFIEGVPDGFLDQTFSVMTRTPQHIYQVLTKRAERLPSYFRNREVPANAWLGVSVENRRHGLPRIQYLRGVNARVRFLSIEPLLEDIGEFDLTGIHWVIVGGESGHGARPMKQQWVENVRQQCESANVAFFFKQWGAWGSDGVRRNKRANGRTLDGQVFDGLPAFVPV